MKSKYLYLIILISTSITTCFILTIHKELSNKDTNLQNLNAVHQVADPNNQVPVISSIKQDKETYTINLINTTKICLKNTKSEPDFKNICWQEVSDNQYTSSLYKNKTYYIWLMDKDNNIIQSKTINTHS